ncbi:MAG: DUF5717 family protein [Clostridium sp.]
MQTRLFEYRDFTEAPFLQDLHVRALYDGLKGRPDRQCELEEFLIGLNVKKPVELKTRHRGARPGKPADRHGRCYPRGSQYLGTCAV